MDKHPKAAAGRCSNSNWCLKVNLTRLHNSNYLLSTNYHHRNVIFIKIRKFISNQSSMDCGETCFLSVHCCMFYDIEQHFVFYILCVLSVNIFKLTVTVIARDTHTVGDKLLSRANIIGQQICLWSTYSVVYTAFTAFSHLLAPSWFGSDFWSRLSALMHFTLRQTQRFSNIMTSSTQMVTKVMANKFLKY